MTQLGYPYTKPRGPIGAMYKSPGPIYMLPPLIGEKDHDMRSTFIKAPSYSLAKMLKTQDYDQSPGPAAYAQNSKMTNTGDVFSPKYTITGMKPPLKFGFGPGPADYNVDPGSKLVFPMAPSYQMGQMLRSLKTDGTPAPNAYTLPDPSKRSEIPTGPRYTMAGRNDAHVQILNKFPGPADYSVGSPDLYLHSNPKYTMGIKVSERSKAELPGPLSYKSELVTAHLPSTPKFTMGIKHSQYKGEFSIQPSDDF
ncbi:hypothetical protein T265_07739 [Opisthorchis viverrini]|uniref:Outer dense fiber protein 3 n=1 Tax=Opisthorchis viverrini TaxID=6198 RepID=A0A074ZBH4_OPIVI|nr:hypothetical protein T265_07739 [Opisthorchis viverrini]KER24641.1 hypothetical protein T265_07739 [Opisthorchis viverrini]